MILLLLPESVSVIALNSKRSRWEKDAVMSRHVSLVRRKVVLEVPIPVFTVSWTQETLMKWFKSASFGMLMFVKTLMVPRGWILSYKSAYCFYFGSLLSEMSQQLFNGLPWNFVQTFTVPRGWSPSSSRHKYQSVKKPFRRFLSEKFTRTFLKTFMCPIYYMHTAASMREKIECRFSKFQALIHWLIKKLESLDSS